MALHTFQVKIWFQNRRMKWRNSKERELLSSTSKPQQQPKADKQQIYNATERSPISCIRQDGNNKTVSSTTSEFPVSPEYEDMQDTESSLADATNCVQID